MSKPMILTKTDNIVKFAYHAPKSDTVFFSSLTFRGDSRPVTEKPVVTMKIMCPNV
jgi:hypothetical protein